MKNTIAPFKRTTPFKAGKLRYVLEHLIPADAEILQVYAKPGTDMIQIEFKTKA